MGFLDCCRAGAGGSDSVAPEGTPMAPGPHLMRRTPTNAKSLQSMLTQAQQTELAVAFDRFDRNGDGHMCARARPARPPRLARRRHCVRS